MTEILMSILAGHWTDVGSRLGKAIEACNKSVATVESRVHVSVRRLRNRSRFRKWLRDHFPPFLPTLPSRIGVYTCSGNPFPLDGGRRGWG